MKKKEIAKIPYVGAAKVKKKYKFIAKVFLTAIKEEEHLFVEIYENETPLLRIPECRLVFTKNDWGIYYPENEVWSSASIRDEYGRNIWEGDMEERDYETYISEEETDMVWEFCKGAYGSVSDRRYTSWTDRLDSLLNKIKYNRIEKRMDNRQKRLKERIKDTPELPADLEEWADRELFMFSHFLYYKRHGRYADIACSACGNVFTVAIKRREGYEGQLEKVIEPPVNGQFGRCPHCGAAGTWRAKGKMKGVYELDKYCFIVQPYKEKGVVVRYVQIGKMYRLLERGVAGDEMEKAEESILINEIARRYLEKGKKARTDFHKFSSYSGEFWDDCNLYGMANITIKPAAVYEKSYQILENTELKYSGAKEFGRYCSSYNLMDYLERYQQFPQIEMFVKMGLYETVQVLIDGRCGIIADQYAKRPEDFLGIYKHRMRELIRKKGNATHLRALQKERILNEHWTAAGIELVKETGATLDKLRVALRYMSMQQLVNHMERYSGVCISEDSPYPLCSSAKTRLRSIADTYFDYLNMREERGYDLNNKIFLFPRDLRQAHDQMVAEINQHKITERELEVQTKYPEIQKNYRKLRNKYFYEDEKYIIRPAKNAREIVQEGRTLHHCVGGNNYLDKHNRGTGIILFLRDKETQNTPYITIEMQGTKLVQWYGAYDKKPDQEEIEKWLKRYLLTLKSRQQLQRNGEADLMRAAV